MKYLIPLAILIALYLWLANRSSTSDRSGATTTATPIAQTSPVPAATSQPPGTALRRPITRTQETLKKVRESQQEE